MSKNNWHRFSENDVGDDECERCSVQVTLEAQMTFTVACPAGDCLSSKNPDRGCVFAPRPGAPCACLYCGRTGGRGADGTIEGLTEAELERIFTDTPL